MTREEREKAIDALKISAPVMAVTQEEFNDYIQTLNKIMNWLEQEPCEDEYIKVPKKALKYRTAGMVAYNAEWLKSHFDIERAVICGAQEPCKDAISRQAVLDHIYGVNGLEGLELSNVFEKHYADFIKSLPPVTPQYTEAEIQKMQDLEFAEIQKAYEIGKAENPNKWIPVSERLPEWHWETYGNEKVWYGERVLACVKEADEYYDLVGVAKYGPHGWESEDEGFCSCLASKPVIAWMPLPKPYKASPTKVYEVK